MSQSDTAHPPSGQLTTPDLPAEEPDEALSPDELFHLLQANRRRDALRYLRDADGPVEMRDIAEQVAAWENDTTVRGISSTQRQRVYIPLYQTHLPKLDEAGVIEYNQSRGIVERTPLADQLDPYLDGVESSGGGAAAEAEAVSATSSSDSRPRERMWDGYYSGVLGLGVVLLGGSVLGAPVLSTLSGIVIGAILSALFGLVTLARVLHNSFVPATG